MSDREHVKQVAQSVLQDYGLNEVVATKLAARVAKGVKLNTRAVKMVESIRKIMGVPPLDEVVANAPAAPTKKKASKKKRTAKKATKKKSGKKKSSKKKRTGKKASKKKSSKKKASKKKTSKKKTRKFSKEAREMQSIKRKAWWAQQRIDAEEPRPGDKTLVKDIAKLVANAEAAAEAAKDAPSKKRQGVPANGATTAAASPA